MIKIITTKKWKAKQEEIYKLKLELLNLHQLHKGDFNRHKYEYAELEDKVKDLEAKLRKAEHDKNTALAKLRRKEGK